MDWPLELVLERDALPRLGRRDLEPDVAVLTAAARLTDEAALRLGLLADRLAVGDLRLAHVRLDLELAEEAIDDDLEVQLAHAVNQRLVGLRVDVHLEGRILQREPRQRHSELFLVGLRLRLDGDRDDGRREVHRLEANGLGGIAQRVARARVLEPDHRRDVARRDRLDLLALVGVHAQQAADALLLLARGVVHAGAGG